MIVCVYQPDIRDVKEGLWYIMRLNTDENGATKLRTWLVGT